MTYSINNTQTCAIIKEIKEEVKQQDFYKKNKCKINKLIKKISKNLREDQLPLKGIKVKKYIDKNESKKIKEIVKRKTSNNVNTKNTLNTPSPISKPYVNPTTPIHETIDGIQNAGNSCYLNSLVQALRHTPSIRTILQNSHWTPNKELVSLFTRLDEGKLITEETIHNFRKRLIQFQAHIGEFTMEDPSEILEFLLDQIEMPQIIYHKTNNYDLKEVMPIDYLQDANVMKHIMQVPLEKSDRQHTINELFTTNHHEEEVIFSEISQRNQDHELLRDIFTGKDKLTFPVEATISVVTTPNFLPLVLNRYTGPLEKNTSAVTPEIDLFAQQYNTETLTHYQLKAVIIHRGERLNTGHYYTYIPTEAGNTISWNKYDDAKVTYNIREQDALDDIMKNGYVYLYEKAN